VAQIKKVEEGSIIIDYGDFISFVPLVVDGLIKVLRINEQDNEILLYFLSGGDTCASSFSCCMIQKRSEIQAIAEEDSMLIAIPMESADRWMSEYKVWRDFVFSNYDQKLFQLIDTIDRLAFSQLDDKLVDYLEERAKYTTDNVVHVTHSAIAQDLNVSREAVSRMLKKMEQKGMVKLERNTISLMH
jgi:CRP/FNR family transcriptional regulator